MLINNSDSTTAVAENFQPISSVLERVTPFVMMYMTLYTCSSDSHR